MKAGKKIAIIDHGMGNLFSVLKACEYIGVDAEITFDLDIIMKADALILPGVGAFGDAMKKLSEKGLIEPITDLVGEGLPFMGICLGMQLLLSKSEEFGEHKGLGLIGGIVRKIPDQKNQKDIIKIPHMQWNTIYNKTLASDVWNNSPLKGIENNEFMYFVHSYYAEPEDPDIVLSLTNYGGLEFCSSLLLGNIFACQFHPEKSGNKGLKIYKNWADMI